MAEPRTRKSWLTWFLVLASWDFKKRRLPPTSRAFSKKMDSPLSVVSLGFLPPGQPSGEMEGQSLLWEAILIAFPKHHKNLESLTKVRSSRMRPVMVKVTIQGCPC